LKAVYCIGILDFTFDDYETESEKSEVIHTVQLKNQNNKVFFKKLKYIYLEMPNFKKQETDLETRLDKWLYFIQNLENFQDIPEIFRDDIFIQAFENAEIAKYSPQELDNYETSLKNFRDNKATYDYAVDTAFDEGKIEGRMEGAVEIAIQLKQNGVAVEIIAKSTGLTKIQIDKL
jgi:predicted transposase/invertase (TIGR01784 family)